jgi:hypothetical protein
VNSIFYYDPSSQKLLNYDIENKKLNIFDPNSIYERAQFKLFAD